MSPTPISPTGSKPSHPSRTSSQDTTDGIRKRVCKACDRCRLKKSKCDGSSPCSRCKADNAICVFGERKRSQDKIYPKGYVEMLEQQQSQLVSGLKEMYHRLQNASAWDGPSLDESSGKPLTHDILSALNLLESKHDDSGEMEVFEENCEKLQTRMYSEGAGAVHRRGSFSSDSEHSHHDRPSMSSRRETPVLPKPSMFKDNFNFPSTTTTPIMQSPIPISKSYTQHHAVQAPTRPPPLQNLPSFHNDPQLYAPEWAQALADMQDPDCYRGKYEMQSDDFEAAVLNSHWDQQAQMQMQMQMGSQYGHFASFNCNNNVFASNGPLTDMGGDVLDCIDLDFSKFVQQQEIVK